MITTAMCALRCGRNTVEIKMHDSHGLFVGNEYTLNIDGSTRTWKIMKVTELEKPNVDQPEGSARPAT